MISSVQEYYKHRKLITWNMNTIHINVILICFLRICHFLINKYFFGSLLFLSFFGKSLSTHFKNLSWEAIIFLFFVFLIFFEIPKIFLSFNKNEKFYYFLLSKLKFILYFFKTIIFNFLKLKDERSCKKLYVINNIFLSAFIVRSIIK